MDKKGKYTSSLKVGILTLAAISILIFTVLWVKGRSLSGGERIDLAFKDVNGMRAGSAVQMMGLRIGQVEEITPVIQGKDSYVKLRFVVTEKGVKIPYASTISIQQSGIIGEQFLEVTPPKTEYIYGEIDKTSTDIYKNQPIFMQLSEGVQEIGKVVEVEVLKKSQLPYQIRQKLKSKNVVKVAYIIDLPGLILEEDMLGLKISDGKLMFYILDGEIPTTPSKNLKYTVIEPMRLSDFMDLQFRAARSLAETNDRVSEILSDEFIGSLKSSVDNIRILTASANTTLDKATILIDSSRKEIESLIAQSDDLIKSLTKLSDNINKILEDSQTQEIISNTDETMRNLSEITTYINEYTKDEKLKEDITSTINNLANITENISQLINEYNKLEDTEKLKLKSTVKDVLIITRNVKKFSEKLNKRFLLFRLMF